jgi:ABC-type glutathione transport system ATPase component
MGDILVAEDLSALAVQVAQVRSRLDQRKGFALALAERGIELKADIRDLQDQIIVLEKASLLLSSIGEQRQLSAQHQIETLVTRGLQVIFGESMSFHLAQSKRGGLPTVEFIVRTTFPDGSHLDTEVWGATGGGLSAVVGFVLQTVMLLLSPDKAPILNMDEPFAGLSDGYADKLVEFLKELVDKTPLQYVFVAHTHVDELVEIADRRYRFSQVDGETRFKEF